VPERPSFAGITAAVIATAMTGVYVVIAASEGNNEFAGVATFAVLMGIGALSAGIGSLLADGPVRIGLLAVAALVLLPIGMLGIFSIGLPLLVAGLLAAAAALSSAGRAGG
jgi:hypothetical protein